MKKKILLIIIGIIAIIGIVTSILGIRHINYTKTYEYRLSKIGYNKEEVKLLVKFSIYITLSH